MPSKQSGKLHPFQSSIRLSSVHQYPLSSFRSKISRREIANCSKSWQQYWMWLESQNGAFQRGGQGLSLACSAFFEVHTYYRYQRIALCLLYSRVDTQHSCTRCSPKPSLLSEAVAALRNRPSPTLAVASRFCTCVHHLENSPLASRRVWLALC